MLCMKADPKRLHCLFFAFGTLILFSWEWYRLATCNKHDVWCYNAFHSKSMVDNYKYTRALAFGAQKT